jgi:hypothetical protein
VVPTLHLCVSYRSQNKQQLLPYTTLTACFIQPKCRVFTVRYALRSYIKQVRSVFEGLMSLVEHYTTHEGSDSHTQLLQLINQSAFSLTIRYYYILLICCLSFQKHPTYLNQDLHLLLNIRAQQ